MKKKKIAVLHAQVPFVRGGAEIMVENLTRQLKKRGYDADLISMPFKWYPDNVLLDSYLMWRTVDLTQSCGEDIDLVIPLKAPTNAVKHHNKVLWLMHQHRVIYDLRDNVRAGGYRTIPGGDQMINKITQMDTMTISESKTVYAISKNVADRLQKFNGIASTPLYHPPIMEGRYRAGEFGDYILSVSRLDAIKRIDLLIRALPYCDKKIHVVIAGKGQEQDRLQKLAVDLGVADRVQLLGFVPDEELLELYANALGVCFAPVDEDYGYVTLEAFLSQKPIITCHDAGGVLEFAKHEESAFVMDVDPEAIGACFDKLYFNKTLAHDMGMAGYECVKDISWDRAIDELTKTIR